MNDRVTTKERISRAMVSGNLKVSSNGVGDAEYLTALGMAAARANPAASAALRLHLAQDRSSFGDLRRATLVEAQRMNLRERWGLLGAQLRAAVDDALHHYIVPVCSRCQGLRFETVPGTPMLSNRHCRACNGTGERKILAKYERYVRAMLNWLDRIEDDLALAVRGKMRPVVA